MLMLIDSNDLENLKDAERREFIYIQRKSRDRRRAAQRKKAARRATRAAGIAIIILSIIISGIIALNGNSDLTACIAIDSRRRRWRPR